MYSIYWLLIKRLSHRMTKVSTDKGDINNNAPTRPLFSVS